MSRIIVKNLPPKADEGSIRDHFAIKGEITDVRLMRKHDGSSRRFAFVGFRSNDQANEAVKYFNGSFMNTTKLEVQLAKALGDDSLVSRRERALRKRAATELEEAKSKRQKGGELENDKSAKLQEFLNVMKPQKETAMWANDNGVAVKSAATIPSGTTDEARNEDDEEEEEVLNDMTKNNKPEPELEQLGQADAEEEEWNPAQNAEKESEETGDSNENETQSQAVSDLDWLKSRQIRIKENGEIPKPVEESIETEPVQETKSSPESLIAETARLFLRNLAYTVTESDLKELFGGYGAIKEVHVPRDPKTEKPKGMAYIEFDSPESALNAYRELDGVSYQGRLFHILGSKPKQRVGLDEFDLANLPLKKRQQVKRKMQAAKAQFSWNSLYLNQNAVLETVAKRLGVSKSEMMDPHSSNMAVKQALAESSVLESVKSYFTSKGVDLSKFSGKETSDKVILIKNLPFGVGLDEIHGLFSEFGNVVRTLMPPDGGLAVVQFSSSASGRAAFAKMAFRRIGDSIMYLQKAPVGVLDESAVAEEDTKTDKPSVKDAKSASDILLPSTDADIVEDSLETRTSVFIKNLNFVTTINSLTRIFQGIPGFISAQIKTKPDPKDVKHQLSMGFGFAEFRTLENAKTAVEALQGHVLDEHKLQLKLSDRVTGSGDKAKAKFSKSQISTKLLIKNIPFEASKKDIVDLFGTFGKLRSVRLPKKFNRQTRGFGFAEYATLKEAEHAMNSLLGAHLLGRRLVIEYAQAGEDDPEAEIAKMESKVSQQMLAENSAGHRVLGQQKDISLDPDGE